MDLLKISSFLVLIALARCDTKEPNGIIGTDSDFVDVTNENWETIETKVSKDIQNKVKDEENAASDRRSLYFVPNNKCPCFPGNPNGIPISHHLTSPPGTRHERLVVYVYRNRATNEIKVYIPNRARQTVFPDIIYDNNGDVINNLNPNVIETLSKNFGPVINSWTSVIKRQQYKPDINLELTTNLNDQKLKALLLYLQRYKETRPILGSLSGLTVRQKLLQLKNMYPKIYEGFISKVSKFFPVWLNGGQVTKYNQGQLNNFPYDINLIPALNKHQVSQVPFVNGKPQYNIKDIIVYRPLHVDISEQDPELNSEIMFDKWFSGSVNHLNSQLMFASRKIDSVALKTLLIKLLNENGLSNTQSGSLKDATGKTIKWSNLILRPILIGESALVNRVVNNGLFKIPTNIVFVEVIHLTGQQTRTIGIIPVENIFVKEKQVNISTVVIETITTCEADECYTDKRCKNLQGDVIPCQGAKNAENVVIQTREVKDTPSKVIEARRDFKHTCNKLGHCPYDKVEEKGNVSPDVVDIFNNGAYYVNGAQRSGDGILPIIMPFSRTGNNIPFPDDDPYRGRSGSVDSDVHINRNDESPSILPRVISYIPSEEPGYIQVSDEVPGIRIVGGNTAISSGTPVNNKGRSGVPDE